MAAGALTDTMIDTSQGRLHVSVAGQGPWAVLWHSLFVDSASWERVRDRLAERRRLIIIDGPSHGGSEPAARRFTVAECAAAANDVLDALGVDGPVDWVGNAWGGHVGVQFAAAYPKRCRTLVTIGTPVPALSAAERRRIRPLVWMYGITGPIRPLTAKVSEALLGSELRRDDPDAAQLVEKPLQGADRRGMHLAMHSAMLDRLDLTPVLSMVTAPTLLVGAAQDPLWAIDDARSAISHLPGGRVAVLPGAGHIAPLLQAAPALADLICQFWTDPVTAGSPAGPL